MKWMFLGSEFKEPDINDYGFIYKLTFKDTETDELKYYIGKKNFWFLHCKKALQKDKKRNGHIRFINKRKGGKHEIFIKESNWKTYEGSFKKDRANLKLIKKEILMFADSKRHLTYLETRTLFEKRVLETDSFINENILNRFFKGNIK